MVDNSASKPQGTYNMKALAPLNTLRQHDPRCTVFNTAPRKLSHYTSAQTLGLILKNKTIRFNRLDRVNDPKEAMSNDYANAQKLVFASCWSGPDTESMPLWERYSAQMAGVRIIMPTLMFKGRNNNHKVTRDDRYYEIQVDDFSTQIERCGKTVIALSPSCVMGPTKIRYAKSDGLHLSNVFNTHEGQLFDLRQLGTVKIDHWSWEDEYRFRVLAAFDYLFEEEGLKWMSPQSFVDNPVVTEFVDVPLEPTSFDEMEVVLGPRISATDEAHVRELCEVHAQKAKITRSDISIR